MALLPSPALPVLHSRRILTEPDQFGDAVSGIELSVDFQRRQERASSVEQFQSAAWALDFGEANVRTRVRGVLAGGWGSLCLALGPGEAIWNGESTAPGTISLLPPGSEVDGRTAANYAWLTAAVPAEVWNRCLALAGLEDGGPDQLTVGRLPETVADRIKLRFQRHLSLLKDGTATEAQARRAAADVAEAVTDSFASAMELTTDAEPAAGSLRNRARLARRAEVWMRDHLSEAVQVPDLCLALRVSRRELEYAFRTVYDQSPRDHLEALRLNAIRRALQQGDGHRETIIAIAYAHGVRHLGRFSASYRELFGEKPSETRRR